MTHLWLWTSFVLDVLAYAGGFAWLVALVLTVRRWRAAQRGSGMHHRSSVEARLSITEAQVKALQDWRDERLRGITLTNGSTISFQTVADQRRIITDATKPKLPLPKAHPQRKPSRSKPRGKK